MSDDMWYVLGFASSILLFHVLPHPAHFILSAVCVERVSMQSNEVFWLSDWRLLPNIVQNINILGSKSTLQHLLTCGRDFSIAAIVALSAVVGKSTTAISPSVHCPQSVGQKNSVTRMCGVMMKTQRTLSKRTTKKT